MQLSAGETAVAITNYHNALKLNNKLPVAQNNLAMLMVRQPGANLAEARSLARSAVKLAPKTAAYWDTLALVESRMGDVKAAIKSISSAINIDQGDPEWNVDLARILVRAGHMKQAAAVLHKIDPRKLNSPQVPASAKRHYNAMMQRIR